MVDMVLVGAGARVCMQASGRIVLASQDNAFPPKKAYCWLSKATFVLFFPSEIVNPLSFH